MADLAVPVVQSPLANRTGFLANKVGFLIMQEAEEALLAAGLPGRHYMVMTALQGFGTLSQQDLSRLLSIDPTAIVAIVDEMERAGRVERRRNATDRRRNDLHLTEMARAELAKADAIVERIEGDFFATLTRAERASLHSILSRLLVDRWPPPTFCS